MDQEKEFVLILVSIVGSFVLAGGLGYAVYAWLKSKWQRPISADSLRELRDQISQLQTSVDAISLEVERVSEGQRFATKLLAERADAAHVERDRPAH